MVISAQTGSKTGSETRSQTGSVNKNKSTTTGFCCSTLNNTPAQVEQKNSNTRVKKIIIITVALRNTDFISWL